WRTLYAALLESARTTAMLFLILIGALMFAEFINITTMPADLKAWVTRFQVSPVMVVAAICAIYVVLGTAMEELSMVLLTMPVFSRSSSTWALTRCGSASSSGALSRPV